MTEEKREALTAVLQSEEGKKQLELGQAIKKLDKKNDSRLLLVIVLSIITMTIVGYAAFAMIGAVLFLAITVIASFWLYYSSKKNVLLKYLTFYRSRVPRLIAMAEKITVKEEEIPDKAFVSTLSDKGKLAYRMCHNYDGLYIGFVKFMVGSEPILQGLIYYTESEQSNTSELEAVLDERFSSYTLKSENGKAMLFIPGVEDYLNGRVETKDDLTEEALMKQYEYYLLGRRLS